MNKLVGSFKDKRFRYGTFSTAMMLFAVLLFVLVNLLADGMNRSWDLTRENLTTLTTQSQGFLSDLDRDVTLYLLAPTGEEDVILSALLDEYVRASRHVSLEMRDPMINPAFVHRFAADFPQGIPTNSVIVVSDTQYRVVTPQNMIVTGWTQFGWDIISVNFEREITTAIRAVTQYLTHRVYHVTGSGERPLDPEFVRHLSTEGFEVHTFDALLHDVPDTAEVLLISMPQWDWTATKAQRILEFIDNEGRAFVVLGPMTGQERFANMDNVLAAYGVRISDYFVIEGDTTRWFGNPFQIVPVREEHPIMAPLLEMNRNTLMILPGAIESIDMRRPSTVIEPLLTSSVIAYGRHDPSIETLLPTPLDYMGAPFHFAVAVTDRVQLDRPIVSQMVVVGSAAIWSDDVRANIGDHNFAFVVSSLQWMVGRPPGLFIPTRQPPGQTPLFDMSQADTNVMAGIAMGVLPLLSLGIGIFIWARRRHS